MKFFFTKKRNSINSTFDLFLLFSTIRRSSDTYYDYNLYILTNEFYGYRTDYPLYPHTFDDFVFLVFHDRLSRSEMQKSAIRPIALWCCIMVVCSFVLFIYRKFIGARTGNYSTSFLDSVAAFLGNAIDKICSNRPERCFIICFSIFGLVFKILHTDHLFQLFQSVEDNRLSTLSQLIDHDIPVYVDGISTFEKACVRAQEYALCSLRYVEFEMLIIHYFIRQ